jgi:hypothetical protein
MKVARTVQSRGKAGNFDTVGLPIAIHEKIIGNKSEFNRSRI